MRTFLLRCMALLWLGITPALAHTVHGFESNPPLPDHPASLGTVVLGSIILIAVIIVCLSFGLRNTGPRLPPVGV